MLHHDRVDVFNNATRKLSTRFSPMRGRHSASLLFGSMVLVCLADQWGRELCHPSLDASGFAPAEMHEGDPKLAKISNAARWRCTVQSLTDALPTSHCLTNNLVFEFWNNAPPLRFRRRDDRLALAV
ncbi:hypothetical protein DPSP01_009574 [Paraphaeosphaeria sporulosa]